MNELIKVNYDSDRPTILGRDLHEFLEVKTKYAEWFPRMCEYGFIENIDFSTCFSNLRSEIHGGQNKQDHQLTIDMAKEICMLQRSEKGCHLTANVLRLVRVGIVSATNKIIKRDIKIVSYFY